MQAPQQHNNAHGNQKKKRSRPGTAGRKMLLAGFFVGRNDLDLHRKRGGTLMVHGEDDGGDEGHTLALEISEPQPDEECCIAMEPIATYRLDWLPGSCDGVMVIDGQPHLSKAAMPCGHGFNAQALLYYLAKCEMTCPCCRQGHRRVRMARESIPSLALREAMSERLDKVLRDERDEQAESDARIVASLLQEAMSDGGGRRSTWDDHLGRPVLLVFAFPTIATLVPPLVMELPLETSHEPAGRLLLHTSTGAVRELNRNLSMIPLRMEAFSMVVAMRSRIHGVLTIARSERFPSSMFDTATGTPGLERVQCVGPYASQLLLCVGMHGAGGFVRVQLGMPEPVLYSLLQDAALSDEHVVMLEPGEEGGDAAGTNNNNNSEEITAPPSPSPARLFLIVAE